MNKILTGIVLLVCSTAGASIASELYVDQIGSTLDLTITQTGDGNTIGTSIDSVSLTGDSMTFDITQYGNDNTISAVISGNTYTGTWIFNGDTNIVDLTCDETAGTNCETVTLDITTNGSTNTFNIYIGETADSQGLAATFIVDGDNNVIATTVDGANVTIDVTIDSSGEASGNTLTLAVTGDGAIGTTGHDVKLDHTGGNGTIAITQSGNSENNVINMTTDGNDANITINQSN
jgi:hypothetical protein